MKRKLVRKNKWLENCARCGKSHYWEIGKCPSCGVYDIPILVSENACGSGYECCDGCEAYKDHMR